METTVTKHQKNLATFIHVATFSKWVFPFGNFIAPLILWSAQKNKSHFIDSHGTQAINFQLSMLLYTIALLLISVPFFIYQIVLLAEGDRHLHHMEDFAMVSGIVVIAVVFGVLLIGITLFEIIAVVTAAVKASRGEYFKYPLTINFIKPSQSIDEEATPGTNQPVAS